MKSPRALVRFFILAALPALPTGLLAQAAPPSVPAPKAAPDETVTLNAFTVEATTGRSYGTSNLGSATRLKTPAENVPQSISVVNANLIRDLAAHSYDQAIRYVPSVTQRQNVPNGSVIRGFLVSNRYRNGFAVQGFESDLTNIDRIEIIKGPSASIAGASESGGYVNFITKKPLFKSAGAATVSVGTDSFMRGQLDVTGPVANQRGAYRLIAGAVSSHGWRDGERVRKTSMFPSFTWNLGKHTQWVNEIEYVEALTPGGFGTPYLAAVLDAGTTPLRPAAGVTAKVTLPRWPDQDLNTGEQGFDRRTKLRALYSTFTHQFNPVFSARQALIIYQFNNNTYRATVPNAFFFDATGDLRATRSYERAIGQNKAARLQGDIAAQTKLWNDRIGLTALGGYELTRGINKNSLATGSLTSISLINPVNGLPPVTPLATTVNNYGKAGAFALFANTQVAFFQDRAIVTAGYRRDKGKAAWTRNNINNIITNTPAPVHIDSPLYGLTLKPAKWLAVYGVYSEAGALSRDVNIYPNIPTSDPRQIIGRVQPVTTNKEFGAKTNFFNGDLSVSLARFEILQQDNVRNGNDPSVPGGTLNTIEPGNTAKGWELEWSGSVTKRLLIVGGYVKTDTIAPGLKPNGSPRELRGIPKHKVQLFTRYDFKDSNRDGWAVHAGVVYQTEVWGRAENNFRIPGARRYDAGVDYTRGSWSFAAMLENVTDEIFPQAAVNQGSNTVDAPRTAFFTVTHRW